MKSRRPDHTTVAAYLALFVALATGGAYAAERIGTGDLKRNAVTAAKIRPGAVGAAELKRPIVRIAGSPSASTGPSTAKARCEKGELLLSGGGSWLRGGGMLSTVAPGIHELGPRPRAADFRAQGEPDLVPNELEAYVMCLPR